MAITVELSNEEARQMLRDYLQRSDDGRYMNEWVRAVMLRIHDARYPQTEASS